MILQIAKNTRAGRARRCPASQIHVCGWCGDDLAVEIILICALLCVPRPFLALPRDDRVPIPTHPVGQRWKLCNAVGGGLREPEPVGFAFDELVSRGVNGTQLSASLRRLKDDATTPTLI